MPDFMVSSPDGKKFKVTAPDGASPDQVLSYAKAHFAAQNAPAAPPAPAMPAKQDAAPDNMLVAGAKGAAEGFGRTVLGGQQLIGKGLEAVGGAKDKPNVAGRIGKWLDDDAAKGIANLHESTAADWKAHPLATGAGSLVGGAALPGGAAGKLIGKAAPVARAAVSGGLTGILEPVEQAGNYWFEKAKQVGLGSATGAALGRLFKTVGQPAQKGVTPAARSLVDAGVKLTPGQMIGGTAKGLEEKATSVPVTGHFVQQALHEATSSFNIATINKALAPIGASLPKAVQAGHAAVKTAQQAVSTAYDQVLSKMSLTADKSMQRGISSILHQARNGAIPEDLVPELNRFFESRIKGVFSQNSTLNGKQMQALGEDLRKETTQWRLASQGPGSDPKRRHLADAFAAMHDIVEDAIERQNPNFAKQKKLVDSSYAMLTRVEGASARRMQGRGVFTPGDLLQSIKSQDRTIRKRAFAAGDSLLQDWAGNAQDVIGNHTPDSGTAGRLAAMSLLHAPSAIAAGAVQPHVLAGAVLGGLPYTKAGTAAARGVMAGGRGPVAQAVGRAGLATVPFAVQGVTSGDGP